MSRVDIGQITSWRSGELLTEQKLQNIFKLIGDTINKNSEDYELLIKELNSLHLASRWLGQVDNFSSIETFITENKDKPEFLPPNNKPLPSQGDVLFVENNSDDPKLPPDINPGRYMYIFSSDIDGSNPMWVLYNPHTLVKASAHNDGLMSKEDWISLNNLKGLSSVADQILTLQAQVQTNTTGLESLGHRVQGNFSRQRLLIRKVSGLETNKQDKITSTNGTPLQGFKTTTVEANLVEVKNEIDLIAKQNVLIWEPQPQQTISGSTMLSVALPQEQLIPNNFIKVYLTNEDNNTAVITLKVLEDKTTAKGTQTIVAGLNTYTISAYYNGTGFALTTLGGTSYTPTYTLKKVIKDIGMSDYLWTAYMEDNINNFLTENLGKKTQVIESFSNPDGFNGFRAGEEITLRNAYLNGTNSLSIYLGGVRLVAGKDYEEVIGPDLTISKSTKIKALNDINLDIDGILEIETITSSFENLKIAVWNKNSSYVVGSVVLHSGFTWYAKRPSVGQEPMDNNTIYWEKLTTGVDITKLEQDIKDYVNSVVGTSTRDYIDQQKTGANLYYSKNTYTTVDTLIQANALKDTLISRGAYYVNASNQKVVIDINTPIWEVINTQGNKTNLKWKEDILGDVLANVSVLNANQNDIRKQIKAELPSSLTKFTNNKPLYLANEVLESDNPNFKTDFEKTYGTVLEELPPEPTPVNKDWEEIPLKIIDSINSNNLITPISGSLFKDWEKIYFEGALTCPNTSGGFNQYLWITPTPVYMKRGPSAGTTAFSVSISIPCIGENIRNSPSNISNTENLGIYGLQFREGLVIDKSLFNNPISMGSLKCYGVRR